MRIRRLLASAAAALTLIAITPATSHAVTTTTPQPFTEPAFAGECMWHQFGEAEKPSWWLALSNPLCVEYSKRAITVDNGDAVRFLLSEPKRFAVAMLTCRYVQIDHWSFQPTTGATPYVAWDGYYWFDKSQGAIAGHLKNFRVNGKTVGIGDAVQALRPNFPQLADALDDYGAEYGETGLQLPLDRSAWC
ncbi:hypothetical protein ABT272_45390 [Streptomyces sp900105245]|uniref:Uncharacterized protein n=1 Tax=Streptomyces sp. 900105245 TaxID=3154379 RepID=A0ABV1UN19_9ACTN